MSGDRVKVTVSTPVQKSGRVLQLSAMFDLPIAERADLSWDVPLPLDAQPWQVGLIVGPSGSGKTTIARERFGAQIAGRPDWRDEAAIIDDFPEQMGIRDVTGALSAVGLSSPPSWTRPYRTLSNGEQFRADVARVLAEPVDGLTVVDEFTSVVDRQVAKVASHAVQKAVRRRGQKFVAVTCHYDVLDWLQPDWVLDLATAEFHWRSVQPHPPVELGIAPVGKAAWKMFKRHHYLSADISPAARCFGGWIDDRLVAFASYIHFPHPKAKNIKMGHRMVVLPDYQGLGISGRMSEWLGEYLTGQGFRYRRVVAHPAVIAYCSHSPRFRSTGSRQTQLQTTSKSSSLRRGNLSSRRLSVRSFEYVPLPR